ncbi:MAG: Flp pilus assembly complex ATPase component TadA, partial [Candidatus Margulisbacteria bacterium]|nr:Flp pilus assembly complex ATPase component TadA [Candidatus Margulisiibacteriota bacterium]
MNVIDQAAEILNKAIAEKASDIHLEAFQHKVQLRFRKDGQLCLFSEINKDAAQVLITRFKVMGSLDIANNRLPQDGKMKYKYHDRFIDLRFATLPTLHGEKIVIRILDQDTGLLSLEKINLPQKIAASLWGALSRNRGLFLVVGPTGSGKTTTL